MFLKFNSNEERRAYGGGDFMELQYCTQPSGTPNKRIVNADFCHWQLTSLYIFGDEFNEFYNEYEGIIGDGLYGNLTEGTIDSCGINYYNAEKTDAIIRRLKEFKPKDYEALLDWLNANPHKNGFYILGV